MMKDLIGQEFGKYRLIRLLGQGGFAEVYLGQHIYLKTEAAIKILHTHMSREQVLGFLQEAQVIARLVHPNIVRVLDFDVANNGVPFLVMDYCPHGTLRQRHANDGPLPLATVLSYVEQIAPALHYAHENKLIHRDIKPENMLIGPQQQILLSDFGIAASAHSTSSMSAQIPIGTIYYMAPEQIQAQARPATDQYALGIAVYEWLCGERPFTGSYTEIFAKHLMTPPPPLRTKVPTLPPLVEEVVHKALAKGPHERFSTVQAFAMALRQAAQSAGVVSISHNTMMPSGTQPAQFAPGGQAPAATVTPNAITPPANVGIPPTQLPVMGMARAGEAQTDLPPLPAYPGQNAQPAQPAQSRPSVPIQPPAMGIVGAGEARTELPPLPAYPGQNAAIKLATAQQGSLPQTQPVGKHSRRNLLIGLGATTLSGLIGLGWITHLIPPSPSPIVSMQHSEAVTDIAWSPDGKYIAVATTPSTQNSAIHICDALDGHNYATINCSSGINTISWSSDSEKIVASFDNLAYSNDGKKPDNNPNVQMWDITTRNRLPYSTTGTAGTTPVNDVAWSPDGNYILATSWISGNYVTMVCNARSGDIFYQTSPSVTTGTAIWSPDSKRIASIGSPSRTVQVWDALTGKNALTYNGHTQDVINVSWSPDGKRIASCSTDQTVQVWDAANGSPVLTYKDSSDVASVAWSPDGKHIASGDANMTVQIWNAADGSNTFTYYLSNPFSSPGPYMPEVIWSPDGKYLAINYGLKATNLVQVYNAPYQS